MKGFSSRTLSLYVLYLPENLQSGGRVQSDMDYAVRSLLSFGLILWQLLDRVVALLNLLHKQNSNCAQRDARAGVPPQQHHPPTVGDARDAAVPGVVGG